MGDLRGITALVTGASSGIGLAAAEAMVQAGAWVGMVARTQTVLAEEAERVGGHAIAMDIASPPAVHRITEYLAELIGGVPDVIVNSAGAFSMAPFAETDPADFDRQVDANLRGPFLVTRAFLPGMLERGSGHIVNVGSIAGRLAMSGNAAYSATKYGLRGMHEVLAAELSGTGVRATLVEPAATDTRLWDPVDPDTRSDLPSRSQMLRAKDVARAILYVVAQPAEVEISHLAIRSIE